MYTSCSGVQLSCRVTVWPGSTLVFSNQRPCTAAPRSGVRSATLTRTIGNASNSASAAAASTPRAVRRGPGGAAARVTSRSPTGAARLGEQPGIAQGDDHELRDGLRHRHVLEVERPRRGALEVERAARLSLLEQRDNQLGARAGDV